MKPTTPRERQEIALKLLGRDGKHQAYFALYDEFAQRENSFIVNIQPQAAGGGLTHAELLVVVDQLIENIDVTCDEMINRIQEKLGNQRSDVEIESLIHMAVQAMIMINSERRSADFTIGGFRPKSWHRDETIVSFCERALPTRHRCALGEVNLVMDRKSALKARKLQRRLGIEFRPTDNLAEHLLFDQKHGHNYLYLFHHAGFLKSHLQQVKESKASLSRGLCESLEQ